MTTPTYPGVYIQELESGVHTITGVATSIAAFIGWAPQGPVGQPTLVQSWGDFQSQFGGLYSGVYLGYAVSQFFANGGQQAYIVRLVDGATTAGGEDTASGIELWASSPGDWANEFYVTFLAGDPSDPDSFGMQVSTATGNLLESFMNVSIDPERSAVRPHGHRQRFAVHHLPRSRDHPAASAPADHGAGVHHPARPAPHADVHQSGLTWHGPQRPDQREFRRPARPPRPSSMPCSTVLPSSTSCACLD